ncbi:hypothetical protein Tco_1030131 [Tanacetum coccineum]|uniref:Uncharacterized protein n=1 Tax=Tanacetum coccineum TaxID=301880 RepID=A0ABQ5G6S1_9ASTR
MEIPYSTICMPKCKDYCYEVNLVALWLLNYMFSSNQKVNISTYTFLTRMVKNLENVSGKFLMYPRFVQVFLEKQLEGMSNHKRIYVTPSHTKKIFGNMRRVGKGFSRRETPLFPTCWLQAQKNSKGSANATDPDHTPTIIQPSTFQPQKKQKPKKPKRKDTEVPQPSGPTDNVADEAVYEKMNDSLVRAAITAFSLEAEQDSGSINKTRSKATLNELSSLGTSSVHDLVGDEVVVESEVASKDVNLNVDEVTLAQALAALKSAKPKADKLLATTPTVSSKGLVIHEQEQATTPTVSSQQPSQLNVHDKELTFKIQAEKEEEERLAREKAQQIKEANIVSWDNVQAMIDADYQMAQQMQARTRRV